MLNKRTGLFAIAMASGLLGVAATLSVEAQQATAAATTTISIATLAPAGSTWMTVFEAWNREVRRESAKVGAPLRMQFYPGGVQGDEAEVIRKIRSGRLDGGAVTAVGLSQIHRPAVVFQLPGMFRNYQQLDNARTALNGELTTSFQAAGFDLIGWADVGQARVFSNTPVQTPQQLAATRPYVWRDDSVMPQFYRAINANPVTLQIPEVLSALQTNRINSFAASAPVAVQLQWATRATHMTDYPMYVTIGATVISRTKMNSLTPAQQQVIRSTGANYHQLARGSLRRAEQQALTSLTGRGITTVAVDSSQRALWEAAFTRTRAAVTGQVADAAFIARVAAFGR